MVLKHPADQIARVSRLELADSALHAPAASFGGIEFYPDLAIKAAVLCTRLVKNHPLADGNKRVGFVCMVEFCLRNGLSWTPPPGDEDGEVSAEMILELAAAAATKTPSLLSLIGSGTGLHPKPHRTRNRSLDRCRTRVETGAARA